MTRVPPEPAAGFDADGWEIPKPKVKARCRRCEKTDSGRGAWGCGVVSPWGIEHVGQDYGMTACGIDATGDGWWWPL